MIVYKSVGQNIVELKLLEDSKTNLERKGVVDKRYAEFRCDKALVFAIYNKLTGVKYNKVYSDYDRKFEYIVGQIAIEKYYDEDIDKIYTTGIHFYLTKEVAF